MASSPPSGPEVVAKIDALVGLPQPSPEAISKVVGAELQMGRRSHKFAAPLPQGVFKNADLRYYKDEGAGLLVLDAHLDPGVKEGEIDLKKYGLPKPLPNPDVAPEGIISHEYTLPKGIKFSVQYTAKTRRLYMVTVEWAGNAAKRPN
jgi:hypothetical protein